MDDGWTGKVTIEAATVVFDREGPSHVLAAGLTSAGEHGRLTSTDADVIAEAIAGGSRRVGRGPNGRRRAPHVNSTQ